MVCGSICGEKHEKVFSCYLRCFTVNSDLKRQCYNLVKEVDFSCYRLISTDQGRSHDPTGRSEWSHDLFKNSNANDRFSQGCQQFSNFGTVTTCSSIEFRGRILGKFKAKNGTCHNVQSLVMGATVEILTHFSVTFLTTEK